MIIKSIREVCFMFLYKRYYTDNLLRPSTDFPISYRGKILLLYAGRIRLFDKSRSNHISATSREEQIATVRK